VPLQVECISDSSTIAGIQEAWVIQDQLHPFLNTPLDNQDPIDGDAPLLRLKLSVAANETAIGVSWHHTLGDATVLLRFMYSISQSYQDLEIPRPFPILERHDFATPSWDMTQRFLPLMPHLAQMQPVSALGALYSEMNKDSTRIQYRVTFVKLRRLRDRVAAELSSTNIRPSIQDCLTSYIVTVITRCSGTQIRFITNAASYRNTQFPFVDDNVAGNAIFIIPALLDDISDSGKNLAGIAKAIRISIEQCRTLDFVAGYMSVASEQMLIAANSGRSMFFGTPPDCFSVNSNLSLDWTSAHFGYPERTRFFTAGVNTRYMRVFRANPSVSETGADDVEICFGVPAVLKSKVMEYLTTELESPDFPHNICIN